MKRLWLCVIGVAILGAVAPSQAGAAFGLNGLEVTIVDKDGVPMIQAGAHPYEIQTSFNANAVGDLENLQLEGSVKDLEIELPVGMVGDPEATPRCSTVDFLDVDILNDYITQCSESTAIGYTSVTYIERPEEGVPLPDGCEGASCESDPIAIYNLEPPPGVAAKFGFWAVSVPVTLEIGLKQSPPFNAIAAVRNVSQVLEFLGSDTVIWGNPFDSSHDPLRGDRCLREGGTCKASIPPRPFLVMPRRCSGPLQTVFRAFPWWDGNPLAAVSGTPFVGVAESQGLGGCASLGFSPRMEVQTSTQTADSPSGMNVSINIDDPGLTDPDGIAQSDVKKTVVTLPEGVTANPSLAEGLKACSPAELARETLSSEPGEGCPQASKVGSLEAETPLLKGELIRGSLFIATPDDPGTGEPGAENPFDTLLSLYMVVKHPQRGVMLKLAGKIEPDPVTGQLVTIFDDLPQVPLGNVRVKLREGARSPLISPPGCGSYTVRADFTPWVDPARTMTTTSSFQITAGSGGAPCTAGPPPFSPGFTAGAIDNNAGAYSPFYLRLTRRDGDQDLTRFSATLPPGVVAKLAGTTRCSEEQIAAARARRGRAEQAAPSCPASSDIGTVVGGAGVGSQLLYAPGKLYLAGPYNGAPLSVVAVVPAVAGPFDVGTVVTRQALTLNPRTGVASVDGSRSDPIPHILAGIPLRVKDVRVVTDRPQFTLNPTSCDPSTVAMQVWGGGTDVFSSADDAAVSLSERFQAANCASLGFKPRLQMTLKGGTNRGSFPALRTVYRPRPGDANLEDMVLRLPRSAFLEQGHFRTICTRVQFAADACPPGAAYGHVTAFTPLLDEPLEGPLYLRSSNNDLPDLVIDLHGIVDVEAVARVDSQKGGIRATLTDIPDAPISKVVVSMQGGQKGLIVNSRNLCAKPSRARAELQAQSGKQGVLRPKVRATGCKKQKPVKRKSR